ncbi:Tyrosine recombinase XerD [Streptococcus sanguinis]|jgi:prophage lambdaSa03, site-specific recombinase, phage integrase family|uniref:Tyrosine recombinase XerD n=2 Tax=Streptococcus sanguinis TaxID=1305 RepID=A0AB74DRG5_STRSA|nr:site-specific integrase [Streptococcus sanguinis]KAF1308535.1 phage integrase family protein [Streptococcus sanguinis OH0843]RSI12617.1 Tyrosine recombinase XerD [Streptococcus sanguinis]RSI43659.1 Tyrosine recombinase XerD [Streptococcus sanguinis]RSI51669.1 Tyrosine recombinase XerD [Streptococcus sanguinis]RSI65601.1 Tyrosine recombinase XerD [Streptococcus sanguinis]
MWIEKLENGKYKFFERYKDPYTEKWRRVSVTLDSGSSRAKKEAQKTLDEKIENVLQKLTTSDRLFADVLEEWWTFYQKEVRRSSVRARKPAYKRLSNNFAANVPIRNIDVAYIKRYIANSDYTASQLNHIKVVLNGVFDYAQELRIITDNPARATTLPKRVITLEKMQSVTEKYLELEELNLLLKELYKSTRTYRAGLLAEFMSLNGYRIGEAVAIERHNYRKESRKLDIHGTLDSIDRNAKKELTKTISSYRTTNLTNREIEIIDEFIKLNELTTSTNPELSDTDYIFLNNHGKPIQRNAFNITLQKANQRLDKPINKPLSSHIFRHTLISMLAERNVPIKAIMARVGHKDSNTTMQIYTHVTKSMKSNIENILDTIANDRK